MNRIKPLFLFIALALGLALIAVMSPIDSLDGWFLVIYGVWLGDLERQLNPPAATQDVGPYLPWDEMHSGERLEYFFGAMGLTALGVLVLIVSVPSSGDLADNWMAPLAGLMMLAAGLGTGYRNWIRRYGPVESE